VGAAHKVVKLQERRSSLPQEVARAILAGFDKHYTLFRQAAVEAKALFERAAWAEMRKLSRDRIQMYDRRVEEAVRALLDRYPEAEVDESLWPAIKLAYIGLLREHKQPECAETFYNSVACEVLHRRYYHNEFIFWRPAVATEHLEGESPTYRGYYPLQDGLRKTLRAIAGSFDLKNSWEDGERDLRNIVRALRKHFPRPARAAPDLQIQVLDSLFFRNKGAYVVGRLINAHRELPFAVPILQNERGELYLDALLVGEDQMLVLFSFARAYFFVDMEVPAAYVSFLRWLMPKKPRTELYMAVGLAKQGKTLFYRDLHYHLRHSTDRFVVAPGIKGMVMLVFTLPSFPYVFKLIRDVFAPPKDIDRQTVMDKYLMVKLHDRVGRMADTLEYSRVALPLERFDPELVAELKRECGSLIELDNNGSAAPDSARRSGGSAARDSARQGSGELVIGHVYIERRMQPLNLHVEELRRDGDEARLRGALREYGNAIKELAGAGIFPGDMLLKNFGVTRHERVVFYDYDEIQPMEDVSFKRIPPPRSYEEELAAEPYWRIGENDVFPEQFDRFLVSDPRAREIFYGYHADLLDPAFWIGKQRRLAEGIQEDVFPYPDEARFPRG
jgi:isocitrate dehydrogenase kinase/phosphatase